MKKSSAELGGSLSSLRLRNGSQVAKGDDIPTNQVLFDSAKTSDAALAHAFSVIFSTITDEIDCIALSFSSHSLSVDLVKFFCFFLSRDDFTTAAYKFGTWCSGGILHSPTGISVYCGAQELHPTTHHEMLGFG